MRFEVPQFIEVEDKIVGPLTWKQFVYLAGGAGSIVIFYLLLPFFFFVIIGIPLGALAGFLAFHKVNNRPFSIFLESLISYFSRSKLYLWRKEEEQSIIVREENDPPLKNSVELAQKQRLAELSRRLEMTHK